MFCSFSPKEPIYEILSLYLIFDQMIPCYKRCKEIGALAMVHAENGHLIDEVFIVLKSACAWRGIRGVARD